MENKYYVYEWFNEDTNEIFYVGKGNSNRYKNVTQRNNYFKNYYNKYNCDVRKVEEFLTENEAFRLEKELIKKYREIGQCKCNLADGGEGCSFQEGSWNDMFRKLQYLHDVKSAMDNMPNEIEYDPKNLKLKTLEELKYLYNEYKEYKKWLTNIKDLGYEDRFDLYELKIKNEEIVMLSDVISSGIASNNKKFKSFLNFKTEMDFILCSFNTDKFLKLMLDNRDYYNELVEDTLYNLRFLKLKGNEYNSELWIKIKSFNIEENFINIKFNTIDDKKNRRVKINLYDIIWGIFMFKNKQIYQLLLEEIFTAPFI